MVCFGFEPGAAEWKVQMNPLSYGGNPPPHNSEFNSLLQYSYIFHFKNAACHFALFTSKYALKYLEFQWQVFIFIVLFTANRESLFWLLKS